MVISFRSIVPILLAMLRPCKTVKAHSQTVFDKNTFFDDLLALTMIGPFLEVTMDAQAFYLQSKPSLLELILRIFPVQAHLWELIWRNFPVPAHLWELICGSLRQEQLSL